MSSFRKKNTGASSSNSKAASIEGAVIGIDLGTSNSSVAVWENGNVKIIPFDKNENNLRMPSCVAFNPTGKQLVGHEAKKQIHNNASNTITDSKRLLGRSFGECRVDIQHLGFTIVAGCDNDKPTIVVQNNGKVEKFYPEAISKNVLKEMIETSKKYLNCEAIKKAVITVPACFTVSQRRATIEAAHKAGLEVIRLINEPSATALAHVLEKEKKHNSHHKMKTNMLIFDLGGGKLDVSLVVDEAGKLQVKATAGDSRLGGIDFDNNMVNHFLNEINGKKNMDIKRDVSKMRILRKECEEGKKKLSTDSNLNFNSNIGNIKFSSSMSRAEFEEINKDLFSRCVDLVKKCLTNAKIESSSVNEVILVGGSTRIPKIQELLRSFFRTKIPIILYNKTQDEESVVAKGAAIQAAIIYKNLMQSPKLGLSDVTSYSLSLRSDDKSIKVTIPKNTTIPTKVKDISWRTSAQFGIKVFEEEEYRTKFVGSLDLFDIANDTKISVSYNVDDNGILQVWSKGKKAKIIEEQTTSMVIDPLPHMQAFSQ